CPACALRASRLLSHRPGAELSEIVGKSLALDLDISPFVRDRVEALAGLEGDLQEMDVHLWSNFVGALVFEFAFKRIARIDVDHLVAIDVRADVTEQSHRKI